MIFCHTRKTASWLVEKMMAEGHAVALLSGELSIEQRIQVLDRFRDGLEKILITTNVLSRGIDVEQVNSSVTALRRSFFYPNLLRLQLWSISTCQWM